VRLKRVVLSGFRAFAATTSVDLDADCIVVSGANGQGKTSLLDGVFWALTGRLQRLGDDEKLVSLYSETGGAAVSLTLSTEQEGDLTVSRRFDGRKTTLTTTLGDRSIEGDELRRKFGRIVAPPSELATEDSAAFATAMARSLYLQQDSIRDFVSADSDDDRFRVVAELCGLGRVTDLQNALQQERKAWTHATNQLEAQVSAKRTRLVDLRERASKLAAGDTSLETLAMGWAEWWRALREILPSFSDPIPDLGSAAADTTLDRAIRSLEAARLDAQRHRDSLAEVFRLLEAAGSQPQTDVIALRAAVSEAESAEATAREALKTAEASNLAIEHELLRAGASDRELRTLAELALRHLSQRCPVCDQGFDKDATANRLQAFLASTPGSDRTLDDLSPLVEALREHQRRTLNAKDALRKAEATAAHLDQLRADLQRRLQPLGAAQESAVDARSRLDSLMREVERRLSLIDSTRAKADQLSLSRARANEVAQREEVIRQLVIAEKDVTESEKLLVGRERAGKVATSIAEEMREASLQIVDSELRRIEPLFQRIWAGIDPHPSLRAVQLISRLNYGKGRLSMRVRDDAVDVSSESPEAVLSSSQQNALAVALFLTLNIGTQSLPLATTVLDDPFQSLDDINLLGLVDLLRRLSGRRQLVVTTHEHRFAQLLARKLRPIDDSHTTKLVEFEGWDRTAPVVTERELARETSPFRFVA
jgi:DNA repair exonuclease SbcCD ATPase subunit